MSVKNIKYFATYTEERGGGRVSPITIVILGEDELGQVSPAQAISDKCSQEEVGILLAGEGWAPEHGPFYNWRSWPLGIGRRYWEAPVTRR